ncbi:MAG: response regulator [Deltaproteobacteria bacterium]|nr:response regulator [Deltaproteobacteria bacterium]
MPSPIPAATQSPTPAPAAKAAVLLVDDNPHNLAAFEASLDGIDAELIKSTSGEHALRQLLSRNDFAVVVLDVQMPMMDGFETARLMRSRQRNQQTPIIFVTAYSRDDVQVLEAYKMGAVDFLFKPITPEVLRAKTSVFIDLHKRSEQVRMQSELLREHERREHERLLEEEKRAWDESAMRGRLEELARSDQRKDEFLAMLGHELRTPLAPIVTALHLLKERLGNAEDVGSPEGKILATVERQMSHLRRLVDDLLDISRINSGKIELNLVEVCLAALVNEVVQGLMPAAQERQHTLEVEMPSEPLVVKGDAVRLTQIATNLLQNAFRYTEPGGRIRVGVVRRGNAVELYVTDNGTGIEPQLLSGVFDMFVQRRSGANGGLGVGLTLVRRLVELHSGTVLASSEGLGKGSQFTVTLPLLYAGIRAKENCEHAEAHGVAQEPPQLTSSADLPVVAAAGDSGTVAVIDDNEDIRETLRELLEAWNYSVRCAGDGIEGVALILEHKPVVSFVDVGMPRMDGFALAREIRGRLGAAPTLVAMTGFGRPSDFAEAAASGFNGYLVKPIDVKDLRKFLPAPPKT